MTESIPSSVQPVHAPQKPVICERLSLVRVPTVGSGIAVPDMRLPFQRVRAPDLRRRGIIPQQVKPVQFGGGCRQLVSSKGSRTLVVANSLLKRENRWNVSASSCSSANKSLYISRI